MHIQVSNTKRRVSRNGKVKKSPKVFRGFSDDCGKSKDYFEKFRQTAKNFYGFPDDNGESEEYYRKFELMKSCYLSPVLILDRLPNRILCGGKVNKKIHIYSKSGCTGLKEGSRILDDEVATTTVGIDARSYDRTATNGEQLLNGRKAMKSPKSRSFTDFIQNFLDEERQNCAQPQCPASNEIENGVIMGKEEYAQLEETKRSNNPTLVFENELNIDNIQKCEVSQKRRTCAAGKVSDHVSGEVIKAENGSVQSRRPSLTCQIPIEAVEIEGHCGSRQSSKCSNTKIYRVDTPRKCQENSSSTECFSFEKMSCEKGKAEEVQTRCSSKRKIQHDNIVDSPTKRPKHSDKSGIRVGSLLPIVDTSLHCKEVSEDESSCGEMDLDDPIAENSLSPVSSGQSIASIESQIFNFYNSVCVNFERTSPVDKTESLNGSDTTDIGSIKTDQDIVENENGFDENEECKCSKFLKGTDDLIEKQRENVLCSEKSEIQFDTKQASVFRLTEDLLIGSPSKSIDEAKAEDDIGIDDACNTQISSEVYPFKRMWLMLQPCAVKLKPLPGFWHTKTKRGEDDSVNYPVVFKAGPKKAFHRPHRPSNSRHRVTKIEPSESNVKGLSKIDLSDGYTLKKLCQLKSIELMDSDCDDESHNAEIHGQLESASVISDSEEDRASSPKLRNNTSPVQSHVLEDHVSSFISHIDDDIDMSKTPQIVDVVAADSVVSENPVPSGVLALHELGFLDNESFQFGKEHPSENIWSDVLDFVEVGEPVLRDIPAPSNLLPLSSEETEDHIPCLDSERPIEVDSLTGKVTISTGFDKNCLETINIKPKTEENEGKRVEGYCNNILGSILSDKEYLMNDPLMSCEETETADLNSSNSSSQDPNLGECEFLTSLIRPEEKARNVSYKLRGKDKIVKGKKYNSDDYLWDNGSPRDSAKGIMNMRKNHVTPSDSRESGEDGKAREASPLNLQNTDSKRIPRKYKRREPNNQNDCDERELKYRASTNWLTQNVKAGKGKNDGSVENDEKSNDIAAAAKETVPTSETLYRDLSTIPYVMKCNLQNRSRKCKNLHPCANANKNFKLFFTLTVGVGRRLSKPLIDTFQNPGSCVINKASAYIAASAVGRRPTTILISALPQVVQAILPVYHSNLLMQLVAETEEIEKKEKRSNSDMAIAETLQFKRALMAMKARFPDGPMETPLNPQLKPPQLKLCSATEQNPPQLILQSVQPGQSKPGYMYKSNQIIAVKSKTDNKFRFVRKCLVSILPKDGKKGLLKPTEDSDGKKFGDSSDIQVETNSEVGRGSPRQKETSLGSNPSAVISTNLKTDAIMGPSNKLTISDKTNESSVSPPTEYRATNTDNDGVRNEPTGSAAQKPVWDSSCSQKSNSTSCKSDVVPQTVAASQNGPAKGISSVKSSSKKWVPLYASTLQSTHTTPQLHAVSSQKSKETQKAHPKVMSANKPKSCQALNVLQVGRTDLRVNNSRSSSFTSGISSMDSDDSGNSSAENEIALNQGKTKSMTHLDLLGPLEEVQGTRDTNESSSSKDHVVPVRSEVIPGNACPKDHSNPQHQTNSPDVIMVPDEVESIDLTDGDEESIDLTGRFPKWSVICTSIPELGFVGVQKVSDRVLIYDKAIVAHPMEFDSVLGLSTFLNSRLTQLPKPPQSKIDLKWILVSSGYLALKNVPPTNSRFWLNSPSVKWTRTDTSKVTQWPKTSQNNTATSEGRHISLLNTQKSGIGCRGPIRNYKLSEETSRPKCQRKFFDRSGTVIRINGQPVVIGTPAQGTRTEDNVRDESISTAPRVSMKYVERPSQGGLMRAIAAGTNRTKVTLTVNKSLLTAGLSSASSTTQEQNCLNGSSSKNSNPNPAVPPGYKVLESSLVPSATRGLSTANSLPSVSASSQSASLPCDLATPLSSPIASNPGLPVIQIALPASSASTHNKSVSSVPKRIVKTAPVTVQGCAPQYIILPGSISPTGQPTKYVLAADQPAVSSSLASSAPGQATRYVLASSQPAVSSSSASSAPGQTTKYVVASSQPLSSTLASSTLKGTHPTMRLTNTVRPPSVFTDSRGQTPNSPAPRMVQANTLRVPGPRPGTRTPGLPVLGTQKLTAIRVPLVSAASLNKTPPVTSMSIPIRAPYKQIVVTPESVKCQTILATSTDFGSKAKFNTPSTFQNLKEPPKVNQKLARNRPILILRKNSADITSAPKKFIFSKT